MSKETAHRMMQNTAAPKSLILQAFRSITPPEGPFNPDGDWAHVYKDTSSLRLGWNQGGLTLTHRVGGKLRIEGFRTCPQNYRYWTIADIQCDADEWATPVAWKVESKVSKHVDDSPYLNSGLMKQAQVENKVLTLVTGKDTRLVKLPGAYTCKWCLLDGVGRMARQGVKDKTFIMLDEYDEPCPEQHIHFHEKTSVKTRRGMMDVLCYQHTGTATMPGVFYADMQGRILFYLAGMQLLALTSVNGKTTGSE